MPSKPDFNITPVRKIEEEHDEDPPEPMFSKSNKKTAGSSLRRRNRKKREMNDENLFESNRRVIFAPDSITDEYKTVNQSVSKENLSSKLKKSIKLRTPVKDKPRTENRLKKSGGRFVLRESSDRQNLNPEIFEEGAFGFTKIKQSLDDMEGYSSKRRDYFTEKRKPVVIKTRNLGGGKSTQSLRPNMLKEKSTLVKERKKLSKRDINGSKSRGEKDGTGKKRPKVNMVEEDDPYKTFHFKDTKNLKEGKKKRRTDKPKDSFFNKLSELSRDAGSVRKASKKKKKGKLAIYS